MRDTNFIVENNAKPIWHPMAHPAEMRANGPKVITAGQGVNITDLDGRTTLDAVGGLWNVNLGYSCDPIKKAIADQLSALPYYSGFRGTSTAPNRLRWSVVNCVSSSRKRCCLSRSTRCQRHTLDASVSRANILSPKKAAPSETP